MKLNHDWNTTLDGKQVQRWSERIGFNAVLRRQTQLIAFEKNDVLPPCKANEPDILVVGLDGGRVQTTLKNQDQTRWREDKVATVTSYIAGTKTHDGQPQKLVSTHLATMEDAPTFGRLARLEAERRGIRHAMQVIVMGDGATWIDTIAQKHFPHAQRIVDWYHAAEHLYEAARAAYVDDEAKSNETAERWKSMLWEGQFDALMEQLQGQCERLGEPPEGAPATDPREVLRKAVGYFGSRRDRMDYPSYRARGWPIGSGVTESGVKLYNKRVKGTEQFWTIQGVESILQLRSEWLNDPEGLHHRLWPTPNRLAA